MNTNRGELQRVFDRFEDAYVCAALANDRTELERGYTYITEYLGQVFDPQYHSKLLLLRRKLLKTAQDIAKDVPKLTISSTNINAITHDTYTDEQEIVRLNGDNRMIFDRETLKDYAYNRLTQFLPVLNPLTNEKIHTVEFFRANVRAAGGARKGRTTRKNKKAKKAKRVN
jgi:hypothetical protein